LVLVKNVKGPHLWLIIFIRLVLDGMAGIQFLLQGKPQHMLAIIKAHLSFYSLLPKMLKKRALNTMNLNYFFVTLIVWDYFILKKKTFNELL